MSVGLTVRRLFTHNAGLKLLSLAIAIFLYSLVHGSEDQQRAIYVDVTAIPPPPSSGKVLVSDLPDRVKVTLRGSRSQLQGIELPTVEMDVTDPSQRYYYFEPTVFDLPPGVDVTSIAPASLPLVWADYVERRIPIEARVGSPRPGLQLAGSPRVEPRTVLVRGAEREIAPMQLVKTQPIEISDIEPGEHELRVRLDAPPLHTDFDVTSVQVHFEIVPEVATRTFRGLAVSQLGEIRATLRPAHVDVTVRGPAAVVDLLTEDRVVPYIQLVEAPSAAGASSVEVQVYGLPAGIEVESIEPGSVLVSM
jgi:YbbR domain-containing protein